MQINFRSILHTKREALGSRETSYGYMRVTRDWLWILGATVVLLVCGSLYSVYEFYIQTSISSDGIVVDEKNIQYRDKEIVDFSTIYAKKETVFKELRSDRPTQQVEEVVVPSQTEGVADIETPEYTDGAETQPQPLPLSS